jgi:O-antigen ligase
MKSPSIIDKIIFRTIIALLVFAPLAFGSVHVWAYSVIQIAVFLLAGLWVLDRLLVSKADTIVWIKTPMNLVMIALLGLILFQTLPLPPWLVEILSPKAFADRSIGSEILKDLSGGATVAPAWMPLTYFMHPSFLELAKLTSYFGMFFLVLNTIKSKRQIDLLVYVLIAVGMFEALYAIYQVFLDAPKVWWWESRVGKGNYASGTFIVSNHFAAYMQMAVCLIFGFLISQGKKTQRMISNLGGMQEVFQRVIAWFSPESTRPKIVFLFVVGIVMAVALIMSASRGGIISISISMLLMSMLFIFKKSYRKYAVLTLFFCLLAFFYALHLGIDPTLRKFEQTGGLAKRMLTSQSMIPMLNDYAAVGVGWGNFRYLYPRYVPGEYDGVSSSGYSHNDWLEAGTETGIPGLVLIYALFLSYIVRVIRVGKKRHNRHALGIGTGVLAGLISISFHSYFDFNMHIPANPLTLAALLAIGYAALHRQGHGYSESFFYRKRTIQLSWPMRMIVAGIVILVVGALFHVTWRHAAAEAACPTEWNSTMNLNWEPDLADIDRAIQRNPTNAAYHFQRALNLTRKKHDIPSDQKHQWEASVQSLRQAIALNPAHYKYWYALGKRFTVNRSNFYDFVNTWLPMADKCYDRAVFCAPKNDGILFSVADYWVWRSQLLPQKDIPVLRGSPQMFQQDGIQKFQDLFRRYLTLNPGGWKKVFNSVWDTYPDDRIVFGIVPAENEELQSLVMQELAKRKS